MKVQSREQSSSNLRATADTYLRQKITQPHSALLAGAVCIGAFVLAMVALCCTKATRYHNTCQTIAAVFFLVTVIRQFGPSDEIDLSGKERSIGGRIGLFLAIALGVVAYSGTSGFLLVSDDYYNLTLAHQPLMRVLWAHLTQGLIDDHGFHIFYRPLGFASVLLDYHLWHNWIPGYHLVSLGLHLSAIVAVFYICRGLSLSDEGSATAAAVFAVLPINAEAVIWVGCRFDQLATALSLWAVACYIRFRQRRRTTAYLATLLLFVLAALAKESAYVVPILCLALELLFWKRQSLKALAGIFAASAGTFLLRLLVLGGVGGYRMENGAPAAPHFGTRALGAVLLRMPSQLMLGYNWLQPHGPALTCVAAATAAVLIALAWFATRTLLSRKLIWFALLWILTAALPVHFLFWYLDPGLTFSRALYIGAPGLALLIAVLLEWGIAHTRIRRACAALLTCLLLVGLLHNIAAWRWNSQMSRSFLTQIQKIEPAPAPGTAFVIRDMPTHLRGVPFFEIGLNDAVRQLYRRTDISATRAANAAAGSTLTLQWTGNPAGPVARLP